LVVGTPIANRNRTELEGLIGFFVNQIALRTDLSGDPTFLEAARRVKDTTLGAYEHQDLPFEKLVEELQPPRTLAHAPLFQIIFGIQNNPTLDQAPSPAGTAQDTALAMPQVHSATAKMDLTWQLAQTPNGLLGVVEYSTDLFDEATVAAMANRFLSLLEQVTEDPEKHLSEFQLLGDSETGGRTLQDFPDVEMTQQDFENLLLELQQS
ncbi:MAG TPA: condensation domain-containing protein, partial [Pyrinomonadaceae bacterium]|nr:condensation domain-containing protein [Pyrinomonadaceae bacterium]